MAHGSFDHLKSSRQHWWLVVASGSLTLICGSIGIWQYDHAHPRPQPIGPLAYALSSLYHALQMLIMHTPHFEQEINGWLEAGRWSGVFTVVATTWMLLWKRFRHEFRLFQLTTWQNHYIVCGLGQKGQEVMRCLKRHDREAQVVVVDCNPDEHFADECAALGACVIAGDATDPSVLRQARVTCAKEAIVVTPEDETNVRIAMGIRRLSLERKSKQPECFVHLENIHLREKLQHFMGNGLNPE